MSGLDGRWVSATGASSGIGAAGARTVAVAGGRVALPARRTCTPTTPAGRSEPAAVPLTCDITSAGARLGGPDAVVDAAGPITVGPGAGTDPDAGPARYEVNPPVLSVPVRAAIRSRRAGIAPAVGRISSIPARRSPNPLGRPAGVTAVGYAAMSVGP